MTIKIVGGNQVICDCTGDTIETYQDRLLVGIAIGQEKSVSVEIYCPQCNSSGHYEISTKLELNFEVESEESLKSSSSIADDNHWPRGPW